VAHARPGPRLFGMLRCELVIRRDCFVGLAGFLERGGVIFQNIGKIGLQVMRFAKIRSSFLRFFFR
jgi:hypothetical protein